MYDMAKPKTPPTPTLAPQGGNGRAPGAAMNQLAGEPKPPPEVDERPKTLLVELPIGEAPPKRYPMPRSTLWLDEFQATAARVIADGLDKKQAKTLNGKRVVSPMDAIRFALEQAYEQL